jgi:hypothetical protein
VDGLLRHFCLVTHTRQRRRVADSRQREKLRVHQAEILTLRFLTEGLEAIKGGTRRVGERRTLQVRGTSTPPKNTPEGQKAIPWEEREDE